VRLRLHSRLRPQSRAQLLLVQLSWHRCSCGNWVADASALLLQTRLQVLHMCVLTLHRLLTFVQLRQKLLLVPFKRLHPVHTARQLFLKLLLHQAQLGQMNFQLGALCLHGNQLDLLAKVVAAAFTQKSEALKWR
jgi:hypothetical protein